VQKSVWNNNNLIKSLEKQQLKVPAHIDYLGDLRDFVTQIGRKHNFSDKVINAFKLSVDEAATNIIRHAYRETEGVITIRAIVRKNSLTISLIDQGKFFDPKRVKDPDLNRYVDIGKKGGLGIFIMRKLMDEIDYRKTEEGNELRITKYREKTEKKKILGSMSSIPFSIKAKYFLRTVGIVAGFITLTYMYFFFTADDKVRSEHIADWRTTNSQINSRIRSVPAADFSGIYLNLEVGPEIYEGYKDQILQLTVEDSAGTIVYSSKDPANQYLAPFSRPADAEQIEPGIYKYKLDGEEVYEFESDIRIRDTGAQYGKAHVYWEADVMNAQIWNVRWDYLKLSLFIMGLSTAGIAFLIYLLLNPFRKLSEWVKNLGTGEIEDEIDIDSDTEIGEIAQAFSGMTKQLRESQKSLADQERIKKEMQVAKEIQQTLLPMEFPELEGYEIAAHYEAAKEVGGDYYDFVEVDKDTLGIAVADVSGKGVPGSLVMTMIRTALRTEARGMKDAAKVLARVNKFVSNDIKKGMFVTVFYLIIDSKKRSLNYASAGHNPMILYRASTNQTYYLNPKGFPIGVQLPQQDYFDNYIESDTIKLTKDDILLLYTDGITEAMNANRDLYGEERLQKVLRGSGKLSASQFAEGLRNDIYSFTEGSPQYDDITLVAIKEKSTREEDELRRAKEAHKLISEGMSIQRACEEVNLTTYAYYNKYKKVFDEEGIEAFEVDDETAVEVKHLSIEEKTKIYDIIGKHPEYGATRIKDELNTEEYGFTELSENKIYDFLVRERLNTKQLREAYIGRAKRSKRRMKPPGTPLMTLDGSLLMEKPEQLEAPESQKPEAKRPQERDPEDFRRPSPEQTSEEDDETRFSRTALSPNLEASSLLDTPLEEILSKESDVESEFDEAEQAQESADEATELASTESEDEEEPETTDSDSDKEADVTHASIDEMMFGSEAVESDDDFDDEQVETEEFAERLQDEEEVQADEPDEQETEEQDTIYEADLSFEELFAGAPEDEIELELTDDEPEDQAASPEAAFDETTTDQDDDTVEIVSEDSEDDEEDEDLTFSSVDELLADTSDQESEAEELDSKNIPEETGRDSDANKEPPEREVVSEEAESEESVSFSDLIQAIDDEIVYVSDHRRPPSDNARIAKDDSNEENGKQEKTLESKEKVLITGIRHYKNNEYDKAIQEFERVISMYPEFKEAHSILGNAYFRSKKYNEAARAYERVKEIDPQDVTAYENMGVIHANRGNYKQALQEWRRVLELNPDRTDIKDKIKKTSQLL